MALKPYTTPGLLPAGNPISSWVEPRRNTLLGFGAGMLSNNWGDIGTSTMQGMALDREYAMDAQKLAQQELENNTTMEWIKANYPQYAHLPPAQAFSLAAQADAAARKGSAPGDNLMSVGGHIYDTTSGQWISPPATADNRQNVSLTPQWAQDANGNWVMLQTSSTGELVQSQLPDGLTLADPRLLNAEKAAGSEYGKSVAGAQFDLPAAQLTRDQTLQAIQDVRNQRKGMDEQFGNILGVPQQWTPATPGSEKANFQVTVERATNRAFMEARQMLKGGGQITDFESRKAEAAITAMQSAMEKGSKTLFLQALDDFERAVNDGYAKLEQQAGMLPQTARQPVMAPATSSGNGWTVLGVE